MKNTLLFLAVIFAPLVIAPRVFAVEIMQANSFLEQSAAPKHDDPYAEGTRAINEGRWSDAAELFTRAASQRGDRAEGALYWKAYAENKEGQSARALETCAQFHRTYPNSRWSNECGALEIEIRGKSGHPMQPQAEQDE